MELGMKSNGVELIGKIPEAWKIMRLKFFLKDIKDGEHGKIKRVADGELFLSAKNISETGLSIGTIESHISKKDYQRIVSNGFPHKNDILFSCVGSIGKCCIYTKDKPIAFQRSVAFLQPNNKIDVKYILYCLQSDMCRAQIEKLINQSTVGGLYLNLIRELFITIPPKDEVKNIVSWLDRNCLAVSHTIDVTRQSIKKLEEYKASVISKAVTKGLNPKAEMQEVTEDWIGKMPKHWKYIRTKYLFEILKRIAGKQGYDILAITQKGIKVKDISTNKGQIAADYSKYQLVYPGDFAMNHMDLLTGWMDLSDKMGVTSPDYRVFRKCSPLVYDKYYRYVFQNLYTTRVYYGLAQGVAEVGRKRLQAPTFRNFKLPVPPLDEQKAIVAYLDKETAAIDRLIAQKQQLIEKFTEYKQSLIYAAVTGKIDCREEASK